MNDEMVKLAEDTARKAHAGQTRWDKTTPYVTHPIAVAARFSNDRPSFKVVALLHDVVEDTPMTLKQLRDLGFSEYIVDSVDAITKREGEDYLDYLDRIIRDPVATAVKIADIDHNLINLKKGSMKDKYRLAKRFLLLVRPEVEFYLKLT